MKAKYTRIFSDGTISHLRIGNSKGFSLVGSIMALAFLGIASFMLSDIFIQFQKAQKQIFQKADSIQLYRELNNLLSDQNICFSVFNGVVLQKSLVGFEKEKNLQKVHIEGKTLVTKTDKINLNNFELGHVELGSLGVQLTNEVDLAQFIYMARTWVNVRNVDGSVMAPPFRDHVMEMYFQLDATGTVVKCSTQPFNQDVHTYVHFRPATCIPLCVLDSAINIERVIKIHIAEEKFSGYQLVFKDSFPNLSYMVNVNMMGGPTKRKLKTPVVGNRYKDKVEVGFFNWDAKSNDSNKGFYFPEEVWIVVNPLSP